MILINAADRFNQPGSRRFSNQQQQQNSTGIQKQP
jgi:hypothetical protein